MPTISEMSDPLMTTTWWSTSNSTMPETSDPSSNGTSSGLPSPTLSSGSSGSASPRSIGSGSTEFSWPSADSGISSSASSGAGSPPLPSETTTTTPGQSIWGSTPASPSYNQLSAPPSTPILPDIPLPAYNPLVPPPPMTTGCNGSSFLFPPPPPQQNQQQRQLLHSFSGGYMSELERLFVREPVPTPAAMPLATPQHAHLPCPVPVKREDDGTLFDLRNDEIAPLLWEDFKGNGIDRELDDMDKIMRSMTMKERKPRRLPTIEELKRHDQKDPVIQKTILLRMVSDYEAKGKTHPAISEIKNSDMLCRFCWKNGETEVIYKSHNLKDKQGRIQCPILYVYECPLCGAKGTNSHTKKYCPMNNADADAPSVKTGRNAAGKRRIVGQAAPQVAALTPYTYAELQLMASALSGTSMAQRMSTASKLWPTTLESYLNTTAQQMLAFKDQ